MDIMPKTRPPYLQRIKNRHGNFVWYFHRKGQKRTRIRGQYGSPEFMAAYDAAFGGRTPDTPGKYERLSLAWCIEQYTASPAWQKLAAESRKQMSYQYTKIINNAGTVSITELTRKTILKGQEDRRNVPSDANKFVRSMTLLCGYALNQEWIKLTPVHGVPKLKTSETGEGFTTWPDYWHDWFKGRWPIGTRERLAYEIYNCTAIRRADAHIFGWQHVKGGQYKIRTGKTGMVVEGQILPALEAALKATPTGDLTFVTTEKGEPYKSKYSFGNWFGDACRSANIQGNGHGIRKAVASEAAEVTATEAQLNSFFGWAHGSRESATYVEKASRKKMSGQVATLLTRTRRKSESAAIPKSLKKKGD